MRCFVGLWPDPNSAARLNQLADDLHARYPEAKRVGAHNLHLTLAFIGELDPAVAASLSSALKTLKPMSGAWRLQALGVFPGARVLWAGGVPNKALAQLAADIRSTLTRLSIRFDSKPFAAHITLLRNFPQHDARSFQRALEPPIDFQLTQPALIVSTQDQHGTRYRSFESAEQG